LAYSLLPFDLAFLDPLISHLFVQLIEAN